MSLVSSTQGKAAFILENSGNSIAGEKDKFTNAFGSNGTVVLANVQANKKALQKDYDQRLLRQNEKREFTPTTRVNYLSLNIVFNKDGKVKVDSQQLSTLALEDKNVVRLSQKTTPFKPECNNTAALSSTSTALWTIEEEKIDEEHSRLIATALDINQTDIVGKLPGKEDIAADLSTRFWQQKQAELTEEISTAVVGNQAIDLEGVEPKDAANVQRWWSGYCTHNQEAMAEVMQNYAVGQKLEGKPPVDRSFTAINSLNLKLFRSEGKITVVFEQNLQNANGRSFQLKGTQVWTNLEEQKKQFDLAAKKLFEGTQIALQAAKKAAKGFGKGATVKADEVTAQGVTLGQNKLAAAERACAAAEKAKELFKEKYFSGLTEKADKIASDGAIKAEAKHKMEEKARAEQGYLGWFANTVTLGYMCNPVPSDESSSSTTAPVAAKTAEVTADEAAVKPAETVVEGAAVVAAAAAASEELATKADESAVDEAEVVSATTNV